MSVFAEEGGDGADLLVLLHGLGATGAAWTPFLQLISTHWRGRWFVPDLPGHGHSARAAHYSVEDGAAAICDGLQGRLHPGGRLVILGHSFGGGIGLVCASGRFGAQPDIVFGVGIKLLWTDQDISRMQTLAAQPAKIFATEDEAWARYLKVSGLAGLVSGGSKVAARGIVPNDSGWRLAMDPAANNAGKPEFNALASAARCPVHLARGGQDPLATLEQTRALDPTATDLGAYGHNVMVEAPELLWAWLEAHRAQPR
jgi:pimeloyl-ACP methyl ester carboxylesterase